VPGLWQGWQGALLTAFAQLHKLLAQLSSSDLPTATASSSSSSNSLQAGSSNSCSSSSSDMQVKRGCLLQLLRSSDWADTVTAFDGQWPDLPAVLDRHQQGIEQVSVGSSSSSSSTSNVNAGNAQQQAADNISQLYADALELCRTVVAAAPLPLVCNNLGCENMAGASEADAARKVCVGCRCRYCSAACQAADWRRHKRACKRMAAAGQACS
jgi:hypothetical protein